MLGNWREDWRNIWSPIRSRLFFGKYIHLVNISSAAIHDIKIPSIVLTIFSMMYILVLPANPVLAHYLRITDLLTRILS